VLNCDAQDWKLPEYNSLYDENLTFFFANPKIRSILVKNGVVYNYHFLIKTIRLMKMEISIKLKQKVIFEVLRDTPANTNYLQSLMTGI